MTLFELIIISIGISLDVFAVLLTVGLTLKNSSLKTRLWIVGLFTSMQVIMPIIGYLVGQEFKQYIEAYDHWVSFILLALIGLRMILSKQETSDHVSKRHMFKLSFVTSIDSLAVGVTFAIVQINLWTSSIVFFITTALFSILGLYLGQKVKTEKSIIAERFGGVILILIGLNILLKHLGIY